MQRAASYVIEPAKSGRSTCRACGYGIDKGELRFGELSPTFGEAGSRLWYHLECAATERPFGLEEALAAYPGEVPGRARLERAIREAKRHVKPPDPYAERAPTGRAHCLFCGAPIPRGSLRVAVERHIETNAFVGRGAGYYHARCARQAVEVPGFVDEVMAHSAALSEADRRELEWELRSSPQGGGHPNRSPRP